MKKVKRQSFVSAIIAAGGSSLRMGGEDKLMLQIGGMPVLAHSLLAFQRCGLIDEIVLSAHPDRLVAYAAVAERYGITKLSKVIKGGSTRKHSVYNAALVCSAAADIIAVHDAARPMITSEDIIAVIEAARQHNSAAAAHKISDTVKETASGYVVKTLDRTKLATVQTPQAADRDLLISALKKAVDDDDESVTDECSALEKLGVKPALVECSAMNVKITYPEDLFLANAVYDRREEICE